MTARHSLFNAAAGVVGEMFAMLAYGLRAAAADSRDELRRWFGMEQPAALVTSAIRVRAHDRPGERRDSARRGERDTP